MDNSSLTVLMRQTFQDCLVLRETKGKEYSGTDDALANFKRNGAAMGISAEKCLMIYMGKHWDSISTYVREETWDKALSEPIEGRLDDLITYAVLLKALISERKQSKTQIADTKPDWNTVKNRQNIPEGDVHKGVPII